MSVGSNARNSSQFHDSILLPSSASSAKVQASLWLATVLRGPDDHNCQRNPFRGTWRSVERWRNRAVRSRMCTVEDNFGVEDDGGRW